MSPILVAALCATTLVASWWLTGAVRRYALARGVIDVPNDRSSHVHPTPRGGGSAIVVTVLAGLLILGAADLLTWRWVAGLVGAGLVVATIGFADDHRHVHTPWRLLAHFAAAAAVLLALDRIPPVDLFGVTLYWWISVAALVIAIVWMINLTNFMDGIDGIAAIEAITVSISAVVMYRTIGAPFELGLPLLLLASAAAGFLLWNWAPAKIFMGDAGSGFLGVTLAACAARAASVDVHLLWGWLILLAVFIVDTSITLIRRMARAERIYEAHRTHAYQHAAIARGAHAPVTIAVGLINLVWLLPMALLAVLGVLPGGIAVAAAYAPLVYAAWQLGAGTSAGGQSMASAKGEIN